MDRTVLSGRMKPQKVYFSKQCDPTDWGDCDSIYFPKAAWLLQHFPWLAVRLFWVCLKLKNILGDKK